MKKAFKRGLEKKNGDQTSVVGHEPTEPDEDTLTWNLACRGITKKLSTHWFKRQETSTAREILGNDFPVSLLNFSIFWGFLFSDEIDDSEPLFLKNLNFQRSNLGNKIEFSKSKLYRLMKTKTEWFPNIDDDAPFAILSSTTKSGSEYFQFLEVFQDSDGGETCLFWFQALIATRSLDSSYLASVRDGKAGEDKEDDAWIFQIPEDEIEGGAATFGECATSLHIPFLAKDLFYLAETPFPSAVFSWERESAFPDIPPDLLPEPVLLVEENESVLYVKLDPSSGEREYEEQVFPSTVSFGYVFKTPTHPFAEKTVLNLSINFDNMINILEDGYTNHRDFDDAAPFDVVVGSEMAIHQDNRDSGIANGESRWIPISDLGKEIYETEQKYLKANGLTTEADRIILLEQIRMVGVGRLVTHAINTLVFSSLIPRKEWDIAIEYLSTAIGMPDDERYNAISNLGVVYFLTGDIDEAEDTFNSLKEIVDDDSPHVLAEVYYYLGLIAKSRNQENVAIKYFGLCANFPSSRYSELALKEIPKDLAEVFGMLELIDEANDLLSEKLSVGDTIVSSGKFGFCTSCGLQFKKEKIVFCGSCGEKQ